jgi:broad specificity phosphatase PhoE
MALARMFWLLDVAKGNEGKRAVRARADKLALDLHSRARDHCHVAVVGHGFMFRFLGGALEARGWRRVNGHMRGYWSRTQFETERR